MKILKILAITFGVVGILLLAGAAVSAYFQSQFLKSAVQASGRVTRLERRESTRDGSTSYVFHPEIEFRDREGRSVVFVSSTGSNPPAYRVGETVDVVYDPNQPERAEINSFWSLWILPLVFLLLGIIFTAVGGGMGGFFIANSRKIAWLKTNGQRIQAEIIHVGPDTSTTVNGMHPYKISAQWQNPQTGAMQVFHSQSLWFDPSRFLSAKTIGVVIDPRNPKRHWMDTSFLPPSG